MLGILVFFYSNDKIVYCYVNQGEYYTNDWAGHSTELQCLVSSMSLQWFLVFKKVSKMVQKRGPSMSNVPIVKTVICRKEVLYCGKFQVS